MTVCSGVSNGSPPTNLFEALTAGLPGAAVPWAPTRSSSQLVIWMGTLSREEACLGHHVLALGWAACRGQARAAPQTGRAPGPKVGPGEETAMLPGLPRPITQGGAGCAKGLVLKFDIRPVNLIHPQAGIHFPPSLSAGNPTACLHLEGSQPTSQRPGLPHR